jgi:hypothetical protein
MCALNRVDVEGWTECRAHDVWNCYSCFHFLQVLRSPEFCRGQFRKSRALSDGQRVTNRVIIWVGVRIKKMYVHEFSADIPFGDACVDAQQNGSASLDGNCDHGKVALVNVDRTNFPAVRLVSASGSAGSVTIQLTVAMADGTSLPTALQRLGITLYKSQIRALYRNRSSSGCTRRCDAAISSMTTQS